MKRAQVYGAVLGVLLSLTFSCQIAMAASSPLRASDYIVNQHTTIQPIGYGLARIDFQVTGAASMHQLGVTEIQIKEKTGTSWTTVRTYRYENYPDLMGHNVLRHSGSITFPGIAGRTYVAHITFFAADANGDESQVITTSPITAY